MLKINTKPEAMKLFDEGHFGNSVYNWYDFDQWFIDSKDNQKYVLRQFDREKGGSGYCKYNLEPLEVVREIARLKKEGYKMSTFCISDAMPDKQVILQGEYMAGPSTLYYSTEKMHMRPALALSGRHAHGPHADIMIQSGMCGRGYEKFCELKDMYPLSVIEFSVYHVPVGEKRWQTIIWEVRNY